MRPRPEDYNWSDTNVTPGTNYEYHILAVNSSGHNDFTGTNVTTITLPPTGLTATPGVGQISLAWVAPTGALNYSIFRGTSAGGETLLASGVTAKTFVDTSVVAGTRYYYTVKANNTNVLSTPPLPAASAPSNEVTAIGGAVVTPTSPTIDFPNGFASGTSGVLTLNGGAAVAGSDLVLTDGGTNEVRSVFTSSPVNVSKFSSTFTFQLSTGANTGDGFAFVIQGLGNTALGSNGGGLGYGTDGSGTGSTIGNSLAIKFDLFNNHGEGSNSTGLFTNGASPTDNGSLSLAGTIDLHSGHLMQATISYDGTDLVETLVDTVTQTTFIHVYSGQNIPGLVGGSSAYVGFTAGTGGATATQAIRSWTYTPATSQVDLSAAFNLAGIQADNTKFTGGLGGSAISANLLGASRSWNGETFNFGTAGAKNLVQALGQTITLAAGNYSKLSFLALADGGSVAPQTFTINYTDGTKQTFSRGISDWHNPQNYVGESKAYSMAYKNLGNGTTTNYSANNAPYIVYGYSVSLFSSKTIASITLPKMAKISILAMNLS